VEKLFFYGTFQRASQSFRVERALLIDQTTRQHCPDQPDLIDFHD
jgi:hypothetical protein